MRFEHPSLRQGLVGAWCPSLGASGLTLIDRSGLNNHGTLTNMGGQENWRTVAGQRPLSFDGTDDYSLIPARPVYQFASGSRFTAAAWIYPAANKNHAVIGFGNNGWTVYVSLGNYLEFAKAAVANSGSSAATTGTVLNTWSHIAVINVVGSTVQFFINGVSVRTAAFTQTYTYATELRIGDAQANNLQWNGALDDIRIYSRALTPAEIRLLASRRGIGLQPMPDRAVSLPRKLFVNVGGTWRDGDAYVNDGGTWKLGTPFVNAGGTWK
jgi:hypothetical protein